MPSIIKGYEYDIFISYRQKDNHSDQWVPEFVDNLKRNIVRYFIYLSLIIMTDGCSSSNEEPMIAPENPPFSGTIFIDPDIIKPSDPTTLDDLISAGVGQRLMFDSRQNTFVTYEAFLFNAFFDDSLTAEVQVNPEFGTQDEAMAAAVKYTEAIGRLPTALREKMETVWIPKGIQPFGGGNNNILIHTGQGELYINDGILEETFVHEAAHTSLDPDHATAAGWIAAQEADLTFISTYAQQFSHREDIAESFLPYLAVRFRSDRISEELKQIILLTMPNRIAYFDSLMLDMHPID